MAVKHLNFAGKQSLGKKVPQAKKTARQPKQFNTSTLAKGAAGAVAGGARQVVAKRAVSNIANSTAKAATAGAMKPIAKKTLSNFAKRTAQASTAGASGAVKAGGRAAQPKSSPTFTNMVKSFAAGAMNGLPGAQPKPKSTKRTVRNVKGH